MGNFGDVFNLAILQKITKFKTCQCIRMTDSTNLLLAKVSRYTVHVIIVMIHALRVEWKT